jgi:transposase
MTKHKRLKLREERPLVRRGPRERSQDQTRATPAQHSSREPARDVGGASEAEQTELLANKPLQPVQRQSLTTGIVQAQGNQHAQRVVNTVKAQRQREEQEKVKSDVSSFLAVYAQKHGSLLLTQSLLDVLQMVTSRSEAEIRNVWLPVPKSPHEAMARLGPMLPRSLSKETTKRLIEAKTNLMIQSVVAKPKAAPAAVPAGKKPTQLQEQEDLAKWIAQMLQGKSPQDKSGNTKAVTKLIEAYLATKQGKELKEKALRALLGTKGLPFTLISGSAALAAMVANNTDIPSTPEIPIGDNLSIKVEFEGTFQKPTGIKFGLKFKFGGPKVEKRRGQESTVLALPPELEAYIGRIDRQTLFKWFAQRAFHDWEWAGPEEEENKLAFYKMARDKPEALGLPDAQLVAQHVARSLVEAAIANRIRELEGNSAQKEIQIDLGHNEQWDRLTTLEGLAPRLQWMLGLLLPKVPYGAQGVEQVTFRCGKRLIPVRVKR